MDGSKTRYQVCALNSEDFHLQNKNNPIFTFDHEFQDFDTLKLHRAVIPFTFYVFTQAYTSCTIQGVAVTWPVGNYTPQEWIAVVQPQVAGLTIGYSDITGKMTFTHSTNPVVVSFSATQLAYEVLGFSAGTNTNGTTTLVTPFVVQMSGPNFLMLRSSLGSFFNRNDMVFSKTARRTAVDSNNILAMIPITVNRNGVIVYEDDDTNDTQFTWDTISDKQISFYFTLGNRNDIVDFNGSSFQLWISGVKNMYQPNTQMNQYTRT
jgi:hypothetical protein